jgi:hypothetical protein
MAAIEQAMARRPEDRFPDALALANCLRAVQEELGLQVSELTPHTGEVHDPAAPAVGPAVETTVLLPGRSRPSRPAGARRTRRRHWLLAAVGAALAVAVGVGAFRAWPHAAPAPHRAPPAAAAPTPAEVAASALEAARPTALVAVDMGASVSLRWRLPPGSRYPLFVQQTAAGGPAAPLRPLGAGTTSTTLTGLDPGAGYCFEVGALVALGQPSAVAWSQPVCIRGAAAG